MFGKLPIRERIKEQLKAIFRGTYRDVLAKAVPGFNLIEQPLLTFINGQQASRLATRTDANVVDKDEVSRSMRNIDTLLGGTLNPITIGLGFLQSVLGTSKQDRVSAELNQLKNYSQLNDSHLFVNDVINYLKKKLNNEISRKEGVLSKLGFRKNKNIDQDPTIDAIKDTLKAWIHNPNDRVLGGYVPEVALYQADIDFNEKLLQDLSVGPHAKYLGDLVPDVSQMVNKMKRQKQLQYARPSGVDPRIPNRDYGKQLATPA